MDAHERQVRIFRTSDRREPFSDWLGKLRDARARQQVQARIARLRLGKLGDVKPIGEGVSELRIDHGPGYRVYFGQDGPVLVILLCGGEKRTQATDIRSAKAFWAQYKQEQKHADR